MKKLDPYQIMQLEAARGLCEKGRRPTVAQYNNAILTKKYIGKPI